MSQYNIEMNSYNGRSYDALYPKTILNNVSDWSNNIYSKSQIDSTINTINSSISENKNKIEELDSIMDQNNFTLFKSGTYNQPTTYGNTSSSQHYTTLLASPWRELYEDAVIFIYNGTYSSYGYSSDNIFSLNVSTTGERGETCSCFFYTDYDGRGNKSGSFNNVWFICLAGLYTNSGKTEVFGTGGTENIQNYFQVSRNENSWLKFSYSYRIYKRTVSYWYNFNQTGIF